jgi:hypothetical protein
MEPAMTKSNLKTIAAALAALTLATTFMTFGHEAQAHPRFGAGLGIGLAAGALIGATAVSNSYYYAPGYRECRYVDRIDRWGYVRTIRVCDVVPY